MPGLDEEHISRGGPGLKVGSCLRCSARGREDRSFDDLPDYWLARTAQARAFSSKADPVTDTHHAASGQSFIMWSPQDDEDLC